MPYPIDPNFGTSMSLERLSGTEQPRARRATSADGDRISISGARWGAVPAGLRGDDLAAADDAFSLSVFFHQQGALAARSQANIAPETALRLLGA